MRRTHALVSFLVTAVLALAVAACGPPTMDGQVARYKTTIDKLDSLATKQPALKPGIDAKKAEFAQQRLLFVVSALRQFFADENFINLLRAEGLATMPRALKARVSGDDHG